jgi:tetratricopeptide (TPR) repeat protein
MLRPALVALLALPGGAELRTSRFAAVASVERIALPASGIPEVVVEPLDATIELRGAAGARSLAQRISALVGQICPEVSARGGSVFLRCRTRRLDAAVVPTGGGTALEVRELRGLPFRGPANQLFLSYDLGPKQSCPGTAPAARGECALAAGRKGEAAGLFRQALSSADSSLAVLRLGDIALSAGDADTALAWYRRATGTDRFVRLAQARLCEVSGSCLDGPAAGPTFDGKGQDEATRMELTLRAARVAVFAGRPAEAVSHLVEVLAAPESGACDTVGQVFCRRVVLAVLHQSEGEGGPEAIDLYLALPDRAEGPLSLEMVRAAAELSARLHAPQFGGNLLAASASWVDGQPELLADHLLRASELYLMAGDRPRARVVYDYAETRFSRKRLTGARWSVVSRESRQLNEGNAEAPGPALSAYEALAAEGARDVAAAYGALARARVRRGR